MGSSSPVWRSCTDRSGTALSGTTSLQANPRRMPSSKVLADVCVMSSFTRPYLPRSVRPARRCRFGVKTTTPSGRTAVSATCRRLSSSNVALHHQAIRANPNHALYSPLEERRALAKRYGCFADLLSPAVEVLLESVSLLSLFILYFRRLFFALGFCH